LVKRLVEMHGGTVEAHSEGAGQGSEFTLRIPLTAGASSPTHEFVNPEAATPRGGRRILVVDDSTDSADSLAEMLRLLGYEVRCAYDGLEAVAGADRFQPDMVLMDIGLPRLNGFDAGRRIRELEHGKNLVLVALTGWGQENDRRRSREAGFDHHLVKPVDFGTLSALLTKIEQRT
jgi:CheY-like chemotaxis protein